MPTLTEKLKVKVTTECVEGVYLKWQNDKGGHDYWLFTGNIKHQPSISREQTVIKNIDDLNGVTSNFEVIRKEFADGFTIYTIFDKKNVDGFKQLIRSKEVQMWDGVDFYTVRVASPSMIVEKDKPYGRLTLRILFNEVYTK
jgi:hypothetical protein